MTISTTSNPKIEAIRQSIRSSYDALNQLIDGPLAALEPEKLYRAPAPGEWTVMENIAHIIEFMPFWADEAAKLVAAPGQPFGRTHQHEGRTRAIREHGSDSLAQAKAALPASYAHLDQVLSTLKDSDLELTGLHPHYGEKKLEWFIAEFITDHFANHIQQMQEALKSESSQ